MFEYFWVPNDITYHISEALNYNTFYKTLPSWLSVTWYSLKHLLTSLQALSLQQKGCVFFLASKSGSIFSAAKIPMTVPVSMLNKQLDEETMEQEMSFYVDANHQENPPKPNNPNLYITTRPELTVYTRYKYTQFRFIYIGTVKNSHYLVSVL